MNPTGSAKVRTRVSLLIARFFGCLLVPGSKRDPGAKGCGWMM
jgi:hypothetical protein